MNTLTEKKLKFNVQVLGEKIKSIRVKWRLTQAQFAEVLNQISGAEISRVKISRWEDGKNEPSASEVVAIAQFANCSINELLGLENPTPDRGDFDSNLTDDIVERIAQATAQKVAQELIGSRASVMNGEKTMSISLSNLAQVRLRVLLTESLRQKKLSFRGAAHAAGLSGEDTISTFAGLLELIVNGAGFSPTPGRLQLEAIAFICCRVKNWHHGVLGYTVEVIPDTSHDSVESLILTLERPVGNGHSVGLNF